MKIGSNIKYLRQQNNITQDQLAEHLGVSYQAVSKWETNVNAPDISMLPKLAKYFSVSLDTLFSENISTVAEVFEEIQDDDVIRIVQLRGKQILKINRILSQDNPPIEIAFPRNCNDRTQYFKVEIYGHVIADGSINGDIVYHKSLQCSEINGDVHTDGDIRVHAINAHKIRCKNIIDCNRIVSDTVQCEGDIHCNQLDTKNG